MIKRNYLNIEKKVISTFKIKKKFKCNFHIYINFLLAVLFFSKLSSKRISKLRILNFSSKITLIMEGIGDYNIFACEEGSTAYTDSLPDEIYINGISENEIEKKQYHLTEEENNITLIWNSPLTNCAHMFRSLQNLIKVDLSEFDTSQVTNMHSMFYNCQNLKSIDLSNLNTSKLTSLRSMFRECTSLVSVDLSSFDTSYLEYTLHMFMGCSSLIFLNFYSLNEKNLINATDMFSNTYENLIYCINENSTSLIKNEIRKLNTSNDCSNVCFQNNIKLDLEKKICVYNATNDSDGYYLDDDNFYKPCFSSCKKCFGKGNSTNNNCKECYDSHTFLNETGIRNNCYKKCEYYYYFDEFNLYECTSEKECPIGYPKLIKEKNKCIDSCSRDDTYKYEYNNTCSSFIEKCNAVEFFSKNCKNNDNEPFDKDNMISNIREEILNGKMEYLLKNITNGDLVVDIENIIYTITTPENQRNNKNKNVSTIDLGECENILKEHHKLSDNEKLYILKIDYFEEGLLIPIVEYEVYSKNEKLDLNYCKDIKINISLPALINEDEDFKYDPQSDYYNDICFIYTTENETDISLSDRKNEFEEKNLSLCESNCEYSGYDNIAKKALCECEIKIKIPLFSDIVINKDKLYKKFYDVKSYINLNVMKCSKVLFTKEGLIRNIGSYIILGIIILYFISLFIFLITGYNNIHSKIIIIKNMNQSKNKNVLTTNNKNNKKRKIKIKNGKIKKFKTKTPSKKYKLEIKKKIKNNISSIQTNGYIPDNNSSKIKLKNKKDPRLKATFIKNNENYFKYNDFEINSLDYKSALLIDKRSYCEYYLSLIRLKHLIIFCFYTYKDYNSKIIKIFLFLFLFSLYLTVNSLFFDDSTMHKIYEENGKFNFIYQIPKIIYSSLICSIVNLIVTKLSLTERNIIGFKLRLNSINKEGEYINLIKCIKIKFTLFFIVSFLFLIFFWYYVSCFCAIYKNTQLHLIKDSIVSLGLTMIYPFVLYLFPGIFRISSLKDKNKNKECAYKISKAFQFI